MSSRFGASFSGSPGQGRKPRSRHPVMSEAQIQAYLVARDAIRRINRSALYFPPHGAGQQARGTGREVDESERRRDQRTPDVPPDSLLPASAGSFCFRCNGP